MLPSIERLPMVQQLIERQLYFMLHAPRQTGKTTVFETLAQELTNSGQYVALLVSVESGNPFPMPPISAPPKRRFWIAGVGRFWHSPIPHCIPPPGRRRLPVAGSPPPCSCGV
ncbi:MAG: hypothetical protein HC837_11375 [Chloroflexaceae bacterium]|nr:hypothetical protein [Chloroflexaceae bacterium]